MDATKVEDDDDPIGWELKVSRLEPPRAASSRREGGPRVGQECHRGRHYLRQQQPFLTGKSLSRPRRRLDLVPRYSVAFLPLSPTAAPRIPVFSCTGEGPQESTQTPRPGPPWATVPRGTRPAPPNATSFSIHRRLFLAHPVSLTQASSHQVLCQVWHRRDAPTGSSGFIPKGAEVAFLYNSNLCDGHRNPPSPSLPIHC